LPPWKSFWLNYIQLAFFKYYWMWLPFALLGGWMAVKEIRRPPVDGSLRASAALLLGWIGVVIASCAFKNAQYPRYVFFALPAVSILTGRRRESGRRVRAYYCLLRRARAAARQRALLRDERDSRRPDAAARAARHD